MTGYEVQTHQNIARIAKSLEKIAQAMDPDARGLAKQIMDAPHDTRWDDPEICELGDQLARMVAS